VLVGSGNVQVEVEQSLQIFDDQMSFLDVGVDQGEKRRKLGALEMDELFIPVQMKESLRE